MELKIAHNFIRRVLLTTSTLIAWSSHHHAHAATTLCYEALRMALRNFKNANDFHPSRTDHGSSEKWAEDGYQPGMYNREFARALGGLSIESFMRERRARGQGTDALDLCGSALVSSQTEAFHSLTGVRKKALEASTKRPWEKSPEHYRELTGDLFEQSTWKKIDASFKNRGIAAADLITLRPLGALNEAYFSLGYYKEYLLMRPAFFAWTEKVLSAAYTRLSTEEGHLLIAVSEEMLRTSPEITSWVAFLNTQGLRANIELSGNSYDSVIKIIKSKDSPTTLPRAKKPEC